MSQLSTLCGASNSPFCKVLSVCNNTCNTNALAAAACASDLKTNSLCSQITSTCTSNPSSCQAGTKEAAIPNARNVSMNIASICTEMPMMKDCSTCPAPDASTGVSNCDVLTVYSNLCLDMTGMTQCKQWQQFCAAGFSQTKYCTTTPTGGNAAQTGAPGKNDAVSLGWSAWAVMALF